MRNRRNKRNFNSDLQYYLNIISKLLIVLIIIALLLFIYSAIKLKNSTLVGKNSSLQENPISEINQPNLNEQIIVNSEEDPLNSSNIENILKTNTKKSTTINMALTGDIIYSNGILNDAYNKESDAYNFSYLFDNIKFNIQTADIALGSLETYFNSSNSKNSSLNNSFETFAYSLKKVGFDVLSTANNHCLDNGYSGLENTINTLDKTDISHTGTFKSSEAQNTILIKNVKGLKVAFLNFSYGTNGKTIPNDKSYCVNLLSEKLVDEQIALAKTEEPDIICVSVHWGNRYQQKQNLDQEKWTNLLFQKGADIIVGNHPHVLQPMEKKEISLPDGKTKTGFVVYSLGNFLSDQTQNNTKASVILNLKITKDLENNKLTFDSITYTPIYIYKNSSKSTQKFSILNLKNTIASYDSGYDKSINSKDYTLFKSELENIKKVFGE